MKKLTSVVVAMLLTLTACSSTNQPQQNNEETSKSALTDGTYTGVGSGHNSNITVNVTVKDGAMDSVEVVEHAETIGLGDKALTIMADAMNESKSSNVDTVAAATISSMGIKAAVNDALKQAGASDEFIKGQTQVAQNLPQYNDSYDYDVVIVGAGGAGLAAAIEAKQAGASVALVEKTFATGGNTLVSGGGLNAPGTKQQLDQGIEDSAEQFALDTYNSGDKEGNFDLIKVMADNGYDATQWLINDINVEFLPERIQQFGGHSVPRALVPVGNHGDELILKLEAAANEIGVDFFFSCEAQHIVMDGNKAVGIKAVSNGKDVTFNASKGVILATGGFASDVNMRKEYNDNYGERFKTTARMISTGDGITMAKEVNAQLVDMEYIQVYPTCNPLTGIISYVANSRFDGAILVNQEGTRFVNEMGRRDDISNAILDQTGSVGYLFWGQEVETVGNMTQMHNVEFNKWIETGLLHQADTIEECAQFFDIDVDTMKATIEAYNASCEDGVDEEFNRSGSVKASLTAPFYIQKVVPSSHHTMGGIAINTDTNVLDVDGNVIEGLYAAGEVVGDIHGTNRLGGNAITDCIVFGRIAGQNASK